MASLAQRLGTQPVPVIQPSAFTFVRMRSPAPRVSRGPVPEEPLSDPPPEPELARATRRTVQCQAPIAQRAPEEEDVQIDQVVVAVPYRLDRELREMERYERQKRLRRAARAERRLDSVQTQQPAYATHTKRTHERERAEDSPEIAVNQSAPVLGIRKQRHRDSQYFRQQQDELIAGMERSVESLTAGIRTGVETR